MIRPEKRTWVAFLAGISLATAGLTAGASFAGSPAVEPGRAAPTTSSAAAARW